MRTTTIALFLIAAVLLQPGCSGGDSGPESAAQEYVAAVKADDSARIKAVTTDSLYEMYEQWQGLQKSSEGLLKSIGKVPPSEMLKDAKVIAITTDKIEGDTAYVNVEVEIVGQQRFERMALKKIDGQWRVAGKQ